MRVHVENDLYISADGREYTLERKRVAERGKQAGEIFYTPIGHYSTLQGAINGLVKLKISESTATTLRELLASVEQIYNDIKAMVYI
jgi:hypothetical protein